MRSARHVALLTALLGALPAGAQQEPTFTAPMVHPLGSPELGATPPDWLKPPTAASAVDRLATPRARAQDLAILFNQVCVQTQGDTDTAISWALDHGYVPTSSTLRALAQNIAGPGPASVYSRGPRDDSLLIVTSRQPLLCMVMAASDVDGKVLRSQMDPLVEAWAVQRKASKPTVSVDLPDNPRYRTVTYQVSVGRQLDTLSMASPVGVGHGVAVLKLLPAPQTPAD